MQEDSYEIHSCFIANAVKRYFGGKAAAFHVIEFDGTGSFFLDFLVYRSFKARISLGFSSRFRTGIVYFYVYIGDRAEMLDSLPGKNSEMSMNYTEEALLNNLKVLDEYLIWCMTDAQKKTFGII